MYQITSHETWKWKNDCWEKNRTIEKIWPLILTATFQQSENGLVQQHYDNTYRRVEQQVETASRSSAMERPSPTKPYPARPKTRVSTCWKVNKFRYKEEIEI